MIKVDEWIGNDENIQMEYDSESNELSIDFGNEEIQINESLSDEDYDKPDKTDYIVAASCGVLTGLLDSFWVGEFLLVTAQKWGREKANTFVVKVARLRGYEGNDLRKAIRFLEKDAPMVSDQMTAVWGGGTQHHFRDFAHHASLTGLVFSLLSQFTGLSFGTNKEGGFEIYEMPNRDLLGDSIEKKIYNGIVVWFFHLVSDMAGSSGSAGKGTGIPGPLLSLAKEISSLPIIKDVSIEHGDDGISIPSMLIGLFNGTLMKKTSDGELIRFDLRTEMGVYVFGAKQSVPVVLNQCVIRAFYFVKRFCLELSGKKIKKISDIEKLEVRKILPFNNRCVVRMITVSSGALCAVDASDAAIRAFISSPKNKVDFAVQFLLRINFINIGSFIISIKNDVSATLSEMRNSNVSSSASKIRKIVENREKELRKITDNSVSIDIKANIDNSGIYEYFFHMMIKGVKKDKVDFTNALKVQIGMERQILQFEDDETKLFDAVATASRHALLVQTEFLMMRLFTLYSVSFEKFDKDATYNLFMPFYRVEEWNKKVAYVFTDSMMHSIPWDTIRKNYSVDRIKVVALVELGDDYETREMIVKDIEKRSDGYVQYIPLKDLFALISEDEYGVYLRYVEHYLEEIKKIVGYRTIIAPSEESLVELMEGIEAEFKSFCFDKELERNGVFKNQIRIVEKNFWKRGMYRALVGEMPFAESFISSEWYYKEHVVSSLLEQTAIIAGYLKSVEQLLFTIVGFSSGTGKTIKKIGHEFEYIEFCEENDDLIDTSLGAIIGYVRHYSDLWDVNSFVKKYIADTLNEYRVKYRNDHFHKDNINSIEEIEEIRKNTFYIHYLLLGSMIITDKNKVKLGIDEVEKVDDAKKDLSYSEFEEWLDRILAGDNLLPSKSKIYFQFGGYGSDRWVLRFTVVDGFSEIGVPEGQRWPYITDELLWDKTNERDEMEASVITYMKRYMREGENAENLKRYSEVWVGKFGHAKSVYP